MAVSSENINIRVTGELRAFVHDRAGAGGIYETPSEYIRDLIRRDKEAQDAARIKSMILEGYQDLAQGRIVRSTGDFKTDLARARDL